jgi:hypothetical protein
MPMDALAPSPTAESMTGPLCWICQEKKADSGEHKTKRSDLLAVLGKPSQDEPFFYHDLHRRNQPVGSLNAKILKNPVRICSYCNNARTQPHDFAWEAMSDRLRSRHLKVGQWVRCNRVFDYATKCRMIDVHLFFLKLTGCMIAEANANGYGVPISLDPISEAIMSGRPHPEFHLQFGRHDGGIGRSNLHVWKTDPGGSILGGWLYQLDTIAVSVIYAQAERFEHRPDLWHPHFRTSRKQFVIADFQYGKRDEAELRKASGGQQAQGEVLGV